MVKRDLGLRKSDIAGRYLNMGLSKQREGERISALVLIKYDPSSFGFVGFPCPNTE